ncbi:MAG: DUF4423 domain-containing protein [Alphaproteobacteria bacterium]|nr:DUF4423 domain-containing protein [Alphaproteobacteria bacterium]
MQIEYDEVARELMRALRGKRSQVAWSRRLGYTSNVAYPWESGRRYPTASEALRAIRRAGRDLDAGLTAFFGRRPAWLDATPADSPEGVAQLLADLRGKRSITDLAAATGLNRHAIGRWVQGRTQPRLPDFLHVVDATSVRLVDFVTAFVDPTELPYTVEPLWRAMEARREGAGRHPWTQAILRVLELEDYKRLTRHRPGWIAARLGIDPEVEATCLAFLQETAQLRWTGTHYVQEVVAVDTKRRPEIGRQLKAHWSHVAADRVLAGDPGQFSYNVFACSDADFEKIRELHLAYFRAMRGIVADATVGERVVVANVQLFALDRR